MQAPDEQPISEEELKQLSPDSLRVFAARCAMRVLPFLRNVQMFSAWDQDYSRWVQIWDVSAWVAAGDEKDFRVLSSIANTADSTNLDAASYAARASARVAVNAIRVTTRHVHAGAIDNAVAAAKASIDAVSTEKAKASIDSAEFVSNRTTVVTVRADVNALLANQSQKAPQEAYFLMNTPLWGELGIPEGWQEVLDHFAKACQSIGCEDVFERHMTRIHGEPFDPKEGRRLWDAWQRRFGDSEPEEKASSETATEKSSVAPENTAMPDGVSGGVPGVASLKIDGHADNDRLGREALVVALANIFESDAHTGEQAIGLLGHWGSGKSSVLNMLERRLNTVEKSKNIFIRVLDSFTSRFKRG